MWLPTFKHTFPSPTPMKRPSTMTATTETTPIANDTTQPVTVMPTPMMFRNCCSSVAWRQSA